MLTTDEDMPTGTQTAGECLLRTSGLRKTYPGVTALDDVSLELTAGEVHAIVGENGAGKSTLIKLLAGAEVPTSGVITVDGRVHQGLTPAAAKDLGISVIYQEFTLVSTLSAADNVFLGDYVTHGAVLDKRTMNARAAELFTQLGVDIDPRRPVEELTTGYQQVVEIAKALAKNARILIMDEPSAPLTAAEVEAMYTVVDTLRSRGITIVYISHRMEEIFRLSDRVTVIRDGKLVETLDTADATRNRLITLMVGRELAAGYPSRESQLGEALLSVDRLTGNGVFNVSFEAHRGEILGFGGLIGAGRTELMELLFGSRTIESGTVTVEGRRIRPRNPAHAIREGIALVPEDRKRHGLVLDFSIHDNIALPLLRGTSRFGVPMRRRLGGITQKYMGGLRIKATNADQSAKTLSGGNQQKVVLAKWLAMEPNILIFDEPTRGIDVGARHEIYLIMNRLAEEGKTILMVSSDMEELIGMSDRVIVMGGGTVRGVLSADDINQEAVLSLAAEGIAQ